MIKDASFVIVPSEWHENNPMTIVEGYSLGKPVIGSKAGGIPELIIENKTGFLFDMGDIDDLVSKIIQANAMSDKDYELFSRAAVQFANKYFSEDGHYKELMKVYNDALTDHHNYE